MKITFKALAGSVSTDSGDFSGDMSELNGIDCQDRFSDYFGGDESFIGKVKGGYMQFAVENCIVYTTTSYTTTEELSEQEVEELSKYTQGQWSDGIGEGFEQNPCTQINGEDIFISPWFYGQKLEITQK